MALGGRVAEETTFGEITTGAQDDIKRATHLARAMVCKLGMSEKMGPVAYGDDEESVFLGRELAAHHDNYSDETARDIDREVRAIIDAQHQRVLRVLTENRDRLDRLARALLERETLDLEEIQAAIDGRELPARDRVQVPTWSEKQKARQDKKRPASIFGAPKPATG